ncbi:MAG: hypothetical protein ACRBFS_08085 [Aureispira sp.]
MLPQIAIFTAGAATTAYTWYQSSKKEKKETPTLGDDLLVLAKYALLAIVVFLLLRWLYNKGALKK